MRRLYRTLMLATALAVPACSPLYIARAGIEEARILSRRRPITAVIADPRTDPITRGRLELVLQARDYAAHTLDLDAGDSYTTYSYVDSDTLLLVVSAAEPDRFQAHTWWFPLVGRVPYKGFFDFAAAHAEATRLAAQGLDTYVRPSAAFSTLGWFNDPLLNTMLGYDDVSLANTVIHEILHNSIYLPGEVSFNESFANFVGERGAIEFFCTRDGPASDRCRAAHAGWHDTLLYGEFLSDLVARLERIYGDASLDRATKLARREVIFADAIERWNADVAPRMQTRGYGGFTRRPLNNATLIGTRLYYDRLPLFEALYERLGYRGAVDAVMAAARRRPDDPWAAAEALLKRENSGATRDPTLDSAGIDQP